MLGFQERSNHKIKVHLCAYAVPPAIDEECSPSYITTSTIKVLTKDQKMKTYPLRNGLSPSSTGNAPSKGPFSIAMAMLVYWNVSIWPNCNISPKWISLKFSGNFSPPFGGRFGRV